MVERGRPREFNRTAALRKAMEVFWRRGYEGTSLKELTAAMGINSPSLYAAFGCKETLFREALGLFEASEGEAQARALRDEPTARAAVEVMLRKSADAYTRPEKPSGCMLVLTAMACSPENDSVRDYCATNRRRTQATLRRRLDRSVSAGDLPKATDTAALSAYYTAVLQGLAIQARDGASRTELHAIIDCAMAAWDKLSRTPDKKGAAKK